MACHPIERDFAPPLCRPLSAAHVCGPRPCRPVYHLRILFAVRLGRRRSRLRSGKSVTSPPDRASLTFVQVDECESAVPADEITRGTTNSNRVLLGKRNLERDDLVWVHIVPNEVHPDASLRDVGRPRPKPLRLIKLGNHNPNKRIECETRTSPWVPIGVNWWRLGHRFTPEMAMTLARIANHRSALLLFFGFTKTQHPNGIAVRSRTSTHRINCEAERSLQLCVLSLGLLQDGDVGVGVFPKSEEVLVGSFRFRGVTLHGIGATELKMGESTDR
jgi:hypothetical protein